MPWYSINNELLIFTLRGFIEQIEQVWLAVGSLKDLLYLL